MTVGLKGGLGPRAQPDWEFDSGSGAEGAGHQGTPSQVSTTPQGQGSHDVT